MPIWPWELVVLGSVTSFIIWLILQRIPEGKLQIILTVGNFFAFVARVGVLFNRRTDWDIPSRYAYIIAVASAIITWLYFLVRKPSKIPLTARMRSKK